MIRWNEMSKASGVFAFLLLTTPLAQACHCPPSPPQTLQDLLTHSILFLGTVTDPGPNLFDFAKLFESKLSRKERKRLEEAIDIDMATAKKLYKRVLPKSAHSRLAKIRTEEDFEKLVKEFFPELQTDKERPVTFTVHETFRGKPSNTRTIWTSQGLGDCGAAFERGKSYLVPAYFDSETGHEETHICLHIRAAEEATTELNFLRSNPSQK